MSVFLREAELIDSKQRDCIGAVIDKTEFWEYFRCSFGSNEEARQHRVISLLLMHAISEDK
jgi:hypothetical protein